VPNQIKIWLPGRAMGKARPRYSSYTRTFHLPEKYAQWKSTTARLIKKLQLPTIDYSVSVKCEFFNFLSSDSDNLTGSVLDALVDGDLLQGDSSSYVIASSGEFVKCKKERGLEKNIGTLVTIEPCTIRTVTRSEIPLTLK
jgi:Holliday junction resolvase RusA-like endonuclease